MKDINKDMSSDTARENASVVDSSGTEWKHEMGNFDDPESLVFRGDEDGYPLRAERDVHDCGRNSSLNNKGKLYNTRYFIIKSLNHDNLQLSIQKGIWATQVMNEPILEEAFQWFLPRICSNDVLCWWRRDNIWSQGCGRSNPWGRSFKIKWLRLNDLPFQKTLHLKNPLNDYKPVKISRDCQELPKDVGEALCELIDGESDIDGMINRDDAPLRRPCIDPPCSLGDGEYNAPVLQMPWFSMSMPCPNFLYQHGAEASRFHLAHQGSGNLPPVSGASKVSKVKHSRTNGNPANLQVQCDMPPQIDAWGLAAESPHASSLTEDDFLEMTYEEYLEVHSRSVRQLSVPASSVKSSRTSQDPPRSKKLEDDSNSDRSHSSKKLRHSSED